MAALFLTAIARASLYTTQDLMGLYFFSAFFYQDCAMNHSNLPAPSADGQRRGGYRWQKRVGFAIVAGGAA